MLHRVVDYGRDSVVGAIAGDDDDVAGLLEERAPVVDVVGEADYLERRLVLECG